MGVFSMRQASMPELQRALARGEFELYFQPIASIPSGNIEALEALVRWRHPREGLLAPSMFLDAIEHSRDAWLFTQHVLESALLHARSWQAAGHAAAVAVNVSAHLVNGTLIEGVSDLCRDVGVEPRCLIVEVTESAVMDDPALATRALAELADLGIGGVAIDDFGTGHSSLGRLRDLPIDALKIDRSFVAELDRGVDSAFLRSVIDLGHYLGLRVVAEGIEDRQTWAALARLGCDEGQGYWLSPPIAGAEVVEWLVGHDAAALAKHGMVGERRSGTGRRALDRIAAAFDRAAEPMLISDRRHRWVAINGAARALLGVRGKALVERHLDDTARTADGTSLTRVVAELSGRAAVPGVCTLALGDQGEREVRFEVRRSFIPDHHVWVLGEA